MRKKRNDFDAVGAERMTDTELSKKLGSYQRMESIGILLGVILVITGCIMMFVYRNIIVICILAFSGVALFLLVAQPAQKKKKALMKQQLGGFFRTVDGSRIKSGEKLVSRIHNVDTGFLNFGYHLVQSLALGRINGTVFHKFRIFVIPGLNLRLELGSKHGIHQGIAHILIDIVGYVLGGSFCVIEHTLDTVGERVERFPYLLSRVFPRVTDFPGSIGDLLAQPVNVILDVCTLFIGYKSIL